MGIREINVCPQCGEDRQPAPDGRKNFVFECDTCGFYASTREVAHADYLANFYPLPDIRVAAQRISSRSMLKYSSAKRAA